MSNPSTKNRSKLRSVEWFGRHDRDALVHRSWMKNQGFPHDQFDGRPVIGICHTWSEATPSLLMGAASCALPTIGVSGGPMLNGKFRREDIGSGTHVRTFTEMLKKGEMTE